MRRAVEAVVTERLEPMVDMIGSVPIEHGERGHDLDADHPGACLCGFDPYWQCDGWLSGDSILGLTLSLEDDGTITTSSPNGN